MRDVSQFFHKLSNQSGREPQDQPIRNDERSEATTSLTGRIHLSAVLCSVWSHLLLGSLAAAGGSERHFLHWKPPRTKERRSRSCGHKQRVQRRSVRFQLGSARMGVFTQEARGASGSWPLTCSRREERRQTETSPAGTNHRNRSRISYWKTFRRGAHI